MELDLASLEIDLFCCFLTLVTSKPKVVGTPNFEQTFFNSRLKFLKSFNASALTVLKIWDPKVKVLFFFH